jgi:hypothetical protein
MIKLHVLVVLVTLTRTISVYFGDKGWVGQVGRVARRLSGKLAGVVRV